MRKLLLIFLAIYCLDSIGFGASKSLTPLAINGVINISDIDLTQQEISLKGEWEFYWDTLLTPQNITNFLQNHEKEYIYAPVSWNTKKGGEHPVKGYATYRLKFISSGKKAIYGIRLHNFYTAARIWFNGEEIYDVGVVGTNKKASKPDYDFKEIPLVFPEGITEHELIVQISNFYHTRAGIVKDIFFGSYDNISHNSKAWLILNLLIIGIIIFISTNHLLNYFLYKNEVTNLFFGLLCLIMIIRSLSTQQRIITFIFPNINWQLLFKLDNFSGFGTIPLFAIFLYLLYRDDFPKWFLYVLVSIGSIISAIVFFTPQIFYGKLRMIFELYVLIGGLSLTFYILLRATIRKREGALLTFIGFLALYSTAINDVLISMNLIHTKEVAPLGLVTYMLLQSFVLSKGSAIAINENKKLGQELKKEKEVLEERVIERTRELELRNDEITKQQNELKEQSWLNESLAKISYLLNENNTNDIKRLLQLLLTEILDLVGAQVGVIYIIDNEGINPVLRLAASKNASYNWLTNDIIEPGEGLLGSCFQDMKMQVFDSVNESYVKIESGLGGIHLKHLVLVPLFTNEIKLGVIEIASFEKLQNQHFKLLEKVSESISSTIQFIRLNVKNIELLKEYKQKQEILDVNESEMRQQLEELQSMREEMERIRSNEK